MNNNSREECGFGCLLNRYKTPIMIGGGVLTALALPFVGPAIGSAAAALGASETLAGGIASAGTSLLASAPLIGGQAVGMIGQETVKYDQYNQPIREGYQNVPVFGKANTYQQVPN